ncbi:exosortase family protein XrtF [Pontibacter ummariensis]|uniref:Exosortase family protein XrtF n=1 Tax=Pontibacter ummariensis TaxID=1610492 RepID=A0A239K633_9BACT|nr:archaeosortase/exosortase family protein [Pontibacter ummariensis]PRY06765.1 exosortase family protein XrtF [Pontibacter ummariensis]SNT13079.1 exosortase family protein XrtF [Pontibacter ummariensis]
MRAQKRLLRFLLYTTGLYLSWFFIREFWLSSIDLWLTYRIADASAWLLSVFGYHTYTYHVGHSVETMGSMIQINGLDVVSIGPPCNGMTLMALFTGFVVAFPGPVLKKLIFIPLGLLAINLLNMVRVTALALNSLYYYQTLDFNHKYTFTVIVYAAVFALWMLWVKKFSNLNNYVSPSTV